MFKMRCEIPILQRCCFCFPLRYGLLVWAYIKQIFSVIFLATLITALCLIYRRRPSVTTMEPWPFLLVVTTLDIAFHTLFLISAHTKDYRKMRIFYRYNVVLLGLHVVVICLVIANELYYVYTSPYIVFYKLSHIILPATSMAFMLLLCQAYLIVLVRSEFMKLKNNSQFEFVNNVAEVRCTGNLDFDNDIPV